MAMVTRRHVLLAAMGMPLACRRGPETVTLAVSGMI